MKNLKTTNEEIEKPQMKRLKNHKWRNWKIINEKIDKSKMKISKYHIWKIWKSQTKKSEIHKWGHWTTNEEFQNPETKKLKIHKWRNWKIINEEFQNPQIENLISKFTKCWIRLDSKDRFILKKNTVYFEKYVWVLKKPGWLDHFSFPWNTSIWCLKVICSFFPYNAVYEMQFWRNNADF